MAVPHRLPGKLRDALGPEAEDFVNWMQSVDSGVREMNARVLRLEASVGELRQSSLRLEASLGEMRQASRADMAEFRQEILSGTAEFRQELLSGTAAFRQEVLSGMAQLRDELKDAIHGVDAKVSQTKADLMMWSFVFWVGAVAAIATLAGVLR